MILVGGAALRELGSKRHTEDTDYLVCVENKPMFFADEKANIDYINAAASNFFKEIFDTEKNNSIASPQALLELKSYAFVHHCQNMFWQKADDAEYDIKFLVRNFGVKNLNRLEKYLNSSELKEIKKIIESVK